MNAIATNRKVILPLSQVYTKHVCKCDECNEIVSTSYGDPREKVFRYDDNNKLECIRMLCSYCIDEMFNYHHKPDLFDYL